MTSFLAVRPGDGRLSDCELTQALVSRRRALPRASLCVRDDLLGRKARGEQVRPNPGLRFGEAGEAWLESQVPGLRPSTVKLYTGAYRNHLAPRWARRRLDTITVEDVAQLVSELRVEGKSEWTIKGVLKAANRTFKFASRRMGWYGVNPVGELEEFERPKTSTAAKRRITAAESWLNARRRARRLATAVHLRRRHRRAPQRVPRTHLGRPRARRSRRRDGDPRTSG